MLVPVRIPGHAPTHRIEIPEVTACEAPIACMIVSDHAEPEYYRIRHHDGRLWWPLFAEGSPLNIARYSADAMREQGPWPAMMEVRPAWVRQYDGTYQEIFEQRAFHLKARRRQTADVASQTLICDGEVYVAAGYPAYFVLPDGAPQDSNVKIVVGPAQHVFGNGLHNYLPPSPLPGARQEAACRSRIFLPDEYEHEILRLEWAGFQVKSQSGLRQYLKLKLPSEPAPARISADEIVRRAVSRIRRGMDRTSRHVLPRELAILPPAPNLVSSEICLQAMKCLHATYGVHLRGRFGLDPTAVKRACERLERLSLTPEDVKAIELMG